jgi:hypothetical protein
MLAFVSEPTPDTSMSQPKHDVANALPEVEMDSAGFAHGLHLLLLAIARTNPAVGALLDEFTSMHAEYLAGLQAKARDSEEYLPVLEKFSRSARLIYQRLSRLDGEQSSTLRAQSQHPAMSALIH